MTPASEPPLSCETIRHSGPVGDVSRKDGEAALVWLGQVLAQ